MRRRLSIRHPDVIIINIKVGGVCGRGDLGYVGSSGLGDVVPVNSSEERMILEIQDPVLSHPANNQSEISKVSCKLIRDQIERYQPIRDKIRKISTNQSLILPDLC